MISDRNSIPQKLAFWTAASIAGCWLIYFVFAPTIGFGLLESWHNEQRALQVVLLLGSTISYLWLSLVVPAVRVAPVLWIAFGLGVLAALLADLPIHAVAEVVLTVQLVFLGAFSATLVRRFPRQASLTLLYAAWLIGAVYVVGVAANYVGVILEQRHVDLEVLILGYANPRFASALHALILPLIAWLALDPTSKRSLRYSSWTIAVLLWTINLALGTRAIWAAFFAAGIGLWWFGGQAGRRAVNAVSASAAAGALIYLLVLLFAPALLPNAGSMHSRVGDFGTASSRLDLWLAAAKAIFAHPWFGIGPMHFAKLHEPAGAHPHNWLLQIGSEWGLPALTVFLFVLYRWKRAVGAAVASRVNAPGDALPAFSLSVVTAIAYGLVDGNWVMPVSQSLAVILVGATVGLLPVRGTAQVRDTYNIASIATIAIALATAAVLGWYTHRTVGLQLQRDEEYTRLTHIQYFLPRFWQQGYLLDEPAD